MAHDKGHNILRIMIFMTIIIIMVLVNIIKITIRNMMRIVKTKMVIMALLMIMVIITVHRPNIIGMVTLATNCE